MSDFQIILTTLRRTVAQSALSMFTGKAPGMMSENSWGA